MTKLQHRQGKLVKMLQMSVMLGTYDIFISYVTSVLNACISIKIFIVVIIFIIIIITVIIIIIFINFITIIIIILKIEIKIEFLLLDRFTFGIIIFTEIFFLFPFYFWQSLSIHLFIPLFIYLFIYMFWLISPYL